MGQGTTSAGVSGAGAFQLLTRSATQLWMPTRGLVIGAGGTARAACFALQQMGCRDISVHNRTHSKAETLAADFSYTQAVAALTPEMLAGVDVVLCTVPASARFVLPAATWGGEEGAVAAASAPRVVLDAAYRPRETCLLKQAREKGPKKTVRVEGLDMLIMQGLAQLRVWTGKEDLSEVVRAAVNRDVRRFYGESA